MINEHAFFNEDRCRHCGVLFTYRAGRTCVWRQGHSDEPAVDGPPRVAAVDDFDFIRARMAEITPPLPPVEVVADIGIPAGDPEAWKDYY